MADATTIYGEQYGKCFLSSPYYVNGNDAWVRCSYYGKTFDVFLPSSRNVCGVNINACKAAIVCVDNFSRLQTAFDLARNGAMRINNTCASFTFCTGVNNEGCFDIPIFDTEGVGRVDYSASYCCHPYIGSFPTYYAFPFWKFEELRDGQPSFQVLWLNRGALNTSRQCVFFSSSYGAINTSFAAEGCLSWTIRACQLGFVYTENAQGIVLPVSYQSFKLWGSQTCCVLCRQAKRIRQPCEVEGVLYFGTKYLAIESLPVRVTKCSQRNKFRIDTRHNPYVDLTQQPSEVVPFHANESRLEYCFMTPLYCIESHATRWLKMMATGVFFFYCNFERKSGAYVALCDNTMQMLTREVCGAKYYYYTFKGYEVAQVRYEWSMEARK